MNENKDQITSAPPCQETNATPEKEVPYDFINFMQDGSMVFLILIFIMVSAGVGKVCTAKYSDHYILSKHFTEEQIRENNLHFIRPYSSLNVSNGQVLPQSEYRLLSFLYLLGMFTGAALASVILYVFDKYLFGSRVCRILIALYHRNSNLQNKAK